MGEVFGGGGVEFVWLGCCCFCCWVGGGEGLDLFVCGWEGREGEGEGGVSGGRSEVEGMMRRILVEGIMMVEGLRGGRSEIGKNGVGKRKEWMVIIVEGGKSEGGLNGKNELERVVGFLCLLKVVRWLELVEGLEYIY